MRVNRSADRPFEQCNTSFQGIKKVQSNLESVKEEDSEEDIKTFQVNRKLALSVLAGTENQLNDGKNSPLIRQDSRKISDVSGSSDRLNESDQELLKQKQTMAYAPIALVLCTELENHDLFRQMLEELFESIRRPEQVTDSLI